MLAVTADDVTVRWLCCAVAVLCCGCGCARFPGSVQDGGDLDAMLWLCCGCAVLAVTADDVAVLWLCCGCAVPPLQDGGDLDVIQELR